MIKGPPLPSDGVGRLPWLVGSTSVVHESQVRCEPSSEETTTLQILPEGTSTEGKQGCGGVDPKKRSRPGVTPSTASGRHMC